MIRDLEGNKVGTHDGIAFHTLGQRKGLNLGGSGEPWFVVAKNKDLNELTVTRGAEHPALYNYTLHAKEMNWFAGTPPASKFSCTAKSRYRQLDQACEVTVDSSGEIDVRFTEPQRAMTPGQYVVLYQDELCLGGGVITTVGPSLYQIARPS